MLILPYNTDAPLYHLPITTVALILVNVAAYLAMWGADPEQVASFVLVYGEGFTPAQWVTRNFVHGDIFHLLGNMFALWSFGLVVEGKIGWWRMLTVVFLIGISQPIIEQTMMLAAGGGGSYGFSAIVFGLMAMCLIWAPENEMQCLLIVLWYGFHIEITIYTLVSVMLIINFTFAVFSGLTITSEFLHLLGAMLGGGVGLFMLRAGMVDCEGWDVFSCWKGLNKMSYAEREALKNQEPAQQQKTAEERAELAEQVLQQFRSVLANGRPDAAWKVHKTISRQLRSWRLPEPDMRALILGFHRQKLWNDSVPVMVAYLRAYPQTANLVRLKLAQILVQVSKRPAQALRVMAAIDLDPLSAQQQQQLQKLKKLAQQQHEDDPYEIVDENWQ